MTTQLMWGSVALAVALSSSCTGYPELASPFRPAATTDWYEGKTGSSEFPRKPVAPSTRNARVFVSNPKTDGAQACGKGWQCEGNTTCRGCAKRVAPSELCCTGTPNPRGTGPECCTGGGLPKPRSDTCTQPADTSPLMHPRHGWYRAYLDRGNWIRPDRGAVVELVALHVIDNGEGTGWPHGPHGNLYWDVFPPDEPLMKSRDGANDRRIQKERLVRGPHRTHDKVDEWLDDEVLTYRGAGLFRWGSASGTEEALVLRIWESDFKSDEGTLGRRNDVIGMERISREATETPCGVWVPFHRYTNEHPRRRMDRIAAWGLLRTET